MTLREDSIRIRFGNLVKCNGKEVRSHNSCFGPVLALDVVLEGAGVFGDLD